jgi:hypothetical protein
LNQLTFSYGGPIIRNKTFFFALFDKQMVNRRSLVTTPVLTETARQGIWRYWEGWNPGPALLADPTSFAAPSATPTGTAASVNFDGTPLRPNFNPTGGAYTLGGLRCFSIYGNRKVDGSPFSAADCPGGTAVINPTPWDPLRTTVDQTGYIMKILGMMPKPNFFAAFGNQTPDGLNTGLYRWVQPRTGSAATNASIGVVQSTNDYNNRNQLNLKIDHNITNNHRVAVGWTWEKSQGESGLAPWDGVLNGSQSRRPQFVTVNATSTLSASLVNEARFGLNYSSEFASSAWTNIDHIDVRDAAQKFILFGGTNSANERPYPVLYNPGANWNGYMGFGSFDFANYSPLYNYADTIRWTRGKHAFSFGGEYRRPSTVGYNGSAYIGANPGNGGGTATPQFFTNANLNNGAAQLPNFLATTRNNAGTLLNTFYGAINAPNTNFWIDGQKDFKNGSWQDVTTIENRFKSNDPYGHQTRGQIQNEWNFFVKDDYKLTNNITLNLGIRYDFTGSPYLTEGLTNRFVGGGLGLFGAGRPSGDDPFAGWLTPANPIFLTGYGTNPTGGPLRCAQGTANPNGLPSSNCNPSLMSQVMFVGPGTDNPDETLIPQKGRFSPAIGLSWQLPWFGEGKTTLRGGFQRTYGRSGAPFTGGLLSGPGADGTTSGVNTSDPRLINIFNTRALNLTDLALVVPATPARLPQDRIFPVGSRSVNINYSMYSPDFETPYTDNWTLTVQRSLTSRLTLEVRAINTLARKLPGNGGPFSTAGTFDLNMPNVYQNPELFDALERTRAGFNDPLFDQMLIGMNLNTGVTGYGQVGQTVNGVLQRGSAHLRRAFATNLANGNYAAVVTSLLTAGTTGAGGLQNVPIDPATGVTLVTSQRALRNGCDRIANNLTAGFTNPDTGLQILPRCFAENYFIANPQLSGAWWAENLGESTYNSLETQITMRPIHGLSLQATYGFSKTMTQPGNGFTNPLRPKDDYGKSLQSVGSDIRLNGTFELPVGPNKVLFGNSSGWIARAIERWQLGYIYNWSDGSPRTFLTNANMLYANGRPNIVGPWDNPKGSVRWDGQNGSYFDDAYTTYQDPQCLSVTTQDNLRASCTLSGLARVVPAGTAGAILVNAGTGVYGIPLLENPKPGQQGNLGSATMFTFGRWSFDANLGKTFQISESKTAQVRIDATNIFNHPTPQDPLGLSGQGTSFNANFGQITGKTGNRTFQAKLRLTF